MRNPLDGPAAGTLRCGYCKQEYPVVAEVIGYAEHAGSRDCIVCPPPSKCYSRWQSDRAAWAAARERAISQAVRRAEAGQEPPLPEWMESDQVAQERLKAARRRREAGSGKDPLE